MKLSLYRAWADDPVAAARAAGDQGRKDRLLDPLCGAALIWKSARNTGRSAVAAPGTRIDGTAPAQSQSAGPTLVICISSWRTRGGNLTCEIAGIPKRPSGDSGL